MLITIEIKEETTVKERLALMAPPGAAAFYIKQDGKLLRVLFAMMRTGELGIDTLTRVAREYKLPWQPVNARPELQRLSNPGSSDFVKYEFVKEDSSWFAADEVLAGFLQAMNVFTALTDIPVDLRTTVESFTGASSAGVVRRKK